VDDEQRFAFCDPLIIHHNVRDDVIFMVAGEKKKDPSDEWL
jgi:hypothetical protein